MTGFRGNRGYRSIPKVLMAFVGILLPILVPTTIKAQNVAIINGEIHTGSGAVLANGAVLVENGIITAVGSDVRIPAGMRVVDAAGRVVTPGFFDSSTSLGVVEVGSYQGTSDGSSGNDQMTAAFSIAEGINPNSTLFPVARVEGTTRAVVAPGTGASMIAGTSALINLGSGSLEEMLDVTPLAMYAVLGEGGANYQGGARPLALLRLREVFQDALDYEENRDAYMSGNRREYALSRLDLEALLPVVRAEIPLVVRADRASDILTALKLGEEFGLDLVLNGAGEGWMVADEIAAAGVPVMTNTISNMPTLEVLGAAYENVTRLHEAGVTVILASFDAHNSRNLKQAAGFAVSYGLPYEVALQAVTLTPARVWGVADRMGSLEVGKVGDVVVWSGDPFEVMSSAELVFIDGEEISYETRQKALLEKYRSLENRPPWG